jgi:hypothetical protein
MMKKEVPIDSSGKAYAITSVSDKDVYINKINIDEFISGDELIERLKPRIKALFDKK